MPPSRAHEVLCRRAAVQVHVVLRVAVVVALDVVAALARRLVLGGAMVGAAVHLFRPFGYRIAARPCTKPSRPLCASRTRARWFTLKPLMNAAAPFSTAASSDCTQASADRLRAWAALVSSTAGRLAHRLAVGVTARAEFLFNPFSVASVSIP